MVISLSSPVVLDGDPLTGSARADEGLDDPG